ncbi:MAG: helix-turn-helix domain-containing protein [Ruthenibacterium lactatiformans]
MPQTIVFFAGGPGRLPVPVNYGRTLGFPERNKYGTNADTGGRTGPLNNMLKQISARRDKYTIQDIDHLRRVFNTMAETLIHYTLSYCPRAAESQLAQVNPLAEINGMVFLDDIIAWSERLIDICHNLLRQTVDDSNSAGSKYIEQNYMHNLTLSQISTAATLAQIIFATSLRRVRKSVSAYLTDLRIQQAKRLLTTTSKSINLIAEDVRYESSSYFIKIFKDTTGMTPNRFRRMNR